MIYVNFVYRDYNGTLPLNNNLHQHFINRLQLASHQSAYKIPCCHGQKINFYAPTPKMVKHTQTVANKIFECV